MLPEITLSHYQKYKHTIRAYQLRNKETIALYYYNKNLLVKQKRLKMKLELNQAEPVDLI